MRKRLHLIEKKSQKYAFTLVELMVVMAIIAVLAILIIGAITIARHAGLEASHRSNATTTQAALESYFASTGHYPNQCMEGGATFDCTTVTASQPCTCPFETTLKDIMSYKSTGVFNCTDCISPSNDIGIYTPECLTTQGGHNIASSLCPETNNECDSNGGGFVEYTPTGGYNLHTGNYNCSQQIDLFSSSSQ